MPTISPNSTLGTVVRQCNFSFTVSASPSADETITSVTISAPFTSTSEPNVTITNGTTSASVSGFYINQFNDECQYIDYDENGEKVILTVNGIQQVPGEFGGRSIVKFIQDTSQQKTITYTITVVTNQGSTSFSLPHYNSNNWEVPGLYLQHYVAAFSAKERIEVYELPAGVFDGECAGGSGGTSTADIVVANPYGGPVETVVTGSWEGLDNSSSNLWIGPNGIEVGTTSIPNFFSVNGTPAVSLASAVRLPVNKTDWPTQIVSDLVFSIAPTVWGELDGAQTAGAYIFILTEQTHTVRSQSGTIAEASQGYPIAVFSDTNRLTIGIQRWVSNGTEFVFDKIIDVDDNLVVANVRIAFSTESTLDPTVGANSVIQQSAETVPTETEVTSTPTNPPISTRTERWYIRRKPYTHTVEWTDIKIVPRDFPAGNAILGGELKAQIHVTHMLDGIFNGSRVGDWLRAVNFQITPYLPGHVWKSSNGNMYRIVPPGYPSWTAFGYPGKLASYTVQGNLDTSKTNAPTYKFSTEVKCLVDVYVNTDNFADDNLLDPRLTTFHTDEMTFTISGSIKLVDLSLPQPTTVFLDMHYGPSGIVNDQYPQYQGFLALQYNNQPLPLGTERVRRSYLDFPVNSNVYVSSRMSYPNFPHKTNYPSKVNFPIKFSLGEYKYTNAAGDVFFHFPASGSDSNDHLRTANGAYNIRFELNAEGSIFMPRVDPYTDTSVLRPTYLFEFEVQPWAEVITSYGATQQDVTFQQFTIKVIAMYTFDDTMGSGTLEVAGLDTDVYKPRQVYYGR